MKETEPVQLRFRANNSANSAKDVHYRKESGWIFIGIHPSLLLLPLPQPRIEEENSKTT